MQQFFRYTFASGIALVADVSLLYALTEWLHLHYLISATAGFSLGAVVAYLFSIHWCFTHRSCQSRQLEFMLFATIGAAGLAINNVLMWSLTELAGLYYMHSKVFTTGVVFLLNYSLRKKILFTPKLAKDQNPSQN